MDSIYQLLVRARRARREWAQADDDTRQEYFEEMRSTAETAAASLYDILEIANEADLLYVGFEDPLAVEERDEDDDEFTPSGRWIGGEAYLVQSFGTGVSVRSVFAESVVFGSDDPPRFLNDEGAALLGEQPRKTDSFSRAATIARNLGGSNVIEALNSLRSLANDIREKQPQIAKRLDDIADKLEMRPPG
jgi:hypothetical protein